MRATAPRPRRPLRAVGPRPRRRVRSAVLVAVAIGLVPTAAAVGATGSTPDDAARPSARAATAAPVVTASRLSPAVRRRMTGRSWRPGCPVPLGRLRYLRIRFHGFDGRERRGELVVHRDAVRAAASAFTTLHAKRFPIRRMRLVDAYGASDHRSIEADNTSAFNCRRVTGGTRWSEHAYGRAVDVNPIENPYVSRDGTTTHRRSRPYLDRTVRRRGMAFRGGALVRAFSRAGWRWGGAWTSPKDFQHFSATGR